MNLQLAPMAGMTNAFYRNLYSELFGNVDTYFAPFIGTNHMRKDKSPLFNDILPEFNHSKLHIIPQLLGNNGEDFSYFAKRITQLGYTEVNWNIGCPYEKVTRKKKGSGILPHSDLIKEFLDDICQQKDYDLSVKMRLGLNTLDEGAKVIDVLNDYPLKSLIIHARYGYQKYSGQVNLDDFERLYKASNHKIIYNGDIFTYDDYQGIQERFPNIDTFMLGRGAMQNPLLPSLIKGQSFKVSEKITLIKDFHDSVYKHYQKEMRKEYAFINKMKEFWTYLGLHLDPSGDILNTIRRLSILSEYQAYVKILFESPELWSK